MRSSVDAARPGYLGTTCCIHIIQAHKLNNLDSLWKPLSTGDNAQRHSRVVVNLSTYELLQRPQRPGGRCPSSRPDAFGIKCDKCRPVSTWQCLNRHLDLWAQRNAAAKAFETEGQLQPTQHAELQTRKNSLENRSDLQLLTRPLAVSAVSECY